MGVNVRSFWLVLSLLAGFSIFQYWNIIENAVKQRDVLNFTRTWFAADTVQQNNELNSETHSSKIQINSSKDNQTIIAIPKTEKGELDEEFKYYRNETARKFNVRYENLYKNCPYDEPETHSVFTSPNKNILVNEENGLEICSVPKSGSTSWHYLIWKLRRLSANLSTNYLIYDIVDTEFNHMTSFNIKNVSKFARWRHGVDDDFFYEPNKQEVYRLILARHPFARLISAWNSIMLNRTDLWKDFIEQYPRIKKYNKTSPDENHVLSWKDVMTYVSETRNELLNYHFQPAKELCDHCKYMFSYVIKLENLDEDYPWLEKRLKLKIPLMSRGEAVGGSIINSNPTIIIQQHMLRLPKKVVKNLYLKYKDDFINFGYTFDFGTYKAGGFE